MEDASYWRILFIAEGCTSEPETRQLFAESVRFASTSLNFASLRNFHGKTVFTKFIVYYETYIFSVCISLNSFSGHPKNVFWT
jgi:hypothetical protein